ncbi:MAG: GIY-YIG nuclease family protein [Planctomycetota bacterium]|jgi:structure-specific endonuclease subunit SLX1
MSYVYLLHSTDNSTYVGATVDLERRLRQHNKIIKGGAHATSMKVNAGQIWERACYVEGFPDWQAALQFEWRWKQISRKLSNKLFPLKRRMIALKQLLALDSSTSKAIPYSQWNSSPNIIFESDIAKNFYYDL